MYCIQLGAVTLENHGQFCPCQIHYSLACTNTVNALRVTVVVVHVVGPIAYTWVLLTENFTTYKVNNSIPNTLWNSLAAYPPPLFPHAGSCQRVLHKNPVLVPHKLQYHSKIAPRLCDRFLLDLPPFKNRKLKRWSLCNTVQSELFNPHLRGSGTIWYSVLDANSP